MLIFLPISGNTLNNKPFFTPARVMKIALFENNPLPYPSNNSQEKYNKQI